MIICNYNDPQSQPCLNAEAGEPCPCYPTTAEAEDIARRLRERSRKEAMEFAAALGLAWVGPRS
jgi:hypothetical protein